MTAVPAPSENSELGTGHSESMGVLANFMDSSLLDLEKKGNLSSAPGLYNPDGVFSQVIHFTPHVADLQLQSFFTASNIKIVAHCAGGFRPAAFLKALPLIVSEMKGANVSVVRGRLPYMGSLLGCLAAKRLGIRSVVSLGGDNRLSQIANGVFNYNSKFLSFNLERLVLHLCDRIIVPNRFTKAYVSQIIGAGRADAKTVVIPWHSERIPKTDISAPDVRELLGLPTNSLLIPVVGFINRYKYSHVLFEALSHGPLNSELPVTVVFCGDGPLRAEGEQRFANRSDVRFVGWQEKPVVQALIRDAFALLIPMSGFVLLEAASLGKPVVTSNVEWHAELVEQRISGALVEPTDPSAWRAATEELLASPDTAAQWGNELWNRFEKDYSPEFSKNLEIRIYRELVSR